MSDEDKVSEYGPEGTKVLTRKNKKEPNKREIKTQRKTGLNHLDQKKEDAQKNLEDQYDDLDDGDEQYLDDSKHPTKDLQ